MTRGLAWHRLGPTMSTGSEGCTGRAGTLVTHVLTLWTPETRPSRACGPIDTQGASRQL